MNERREPVVIVLADDDEDDLLLATEAMEASRVINELHTVNSGDELLRFLKREEGFEDAPRPHLILLDLNMPGMSGREALMEIKETPEIAKIPIVILTTSNAERDVEDLYDLGAASYIKKPVTFEGMTKLIQALDSYWFEIVLLPTVRA